MDWIGSLDLRWLTAICQGIIGCSLMFVTARIYGMPLHNRAETFGPVFTDKGLRWFMHALPLMGFLGAFLVVSGISKWAYFQRYSGNLDTDTANAIGAFEAVMAVFVTTSFISAAWRFGRNGH